METLLPTRVRIGAFELDLKAGEVCTEGRKVRLQEQPFQILLMLVGRSGGLVTRGEIRKKLWPNDTVVEFDHSIHTAINKLRQAFGDAAENPKYIETVARRGYRLIVRVEPPNGSPAPTPLDRAALAAPEAPSSNLSGQKVSHYRVLKVLGGGGMGVVYEAEDLKLGRRVALKFLPEEVTGDAKVLERFEREARAASALDHRNICAIYEFGEHESQPFIAMSLLEGQTLRDKIAAKAAPFVTDDLLDLAIQIAQGLVAAHEKGIIHRDIKPANVFITNRHEAKILDFGLAKLTYTAGCEDVRHQEKPSQEDGSERVQTTPACDLALSLTGVAAGTVPYMSPEQIRGEKLDARTDLFSFGLVIYEMATGRQAFSGDTAAALHESILNRAPIPARYLNPELPPGLEEIIDKALEKDRATRYQTAAGMCSDLQRYDHVIGSASRTSATHVANAYRQKPRWHLPRLLFGLALVVGLIGLGFGFRWFKGLRSGSGKRFSERLLTHNAAENRLIGAAISPDGKHIAYVDPKGLHLSVIETGEVHDVPLPEELRLHLWDVTWFPDGEKLVLTAESEAEGHMIWLTSVYGDAPRKLRSGSWGAVVSPQGSLIAFVSGHNNEVWVMGAEGEDPHKILSGGNETYAALAWSPTGERLAYVKAGHLEGGNIETVSPEGGSPSLVITDPKLKSHDVPGLLWASDGRMIFVANEKSWRNGSNLWEIMTDPRTGKPSGSATKVTNWDGMSPYSASVSVDAKRLALVKGHIRDDVYVGELKDARTLMASPTRLTVSESEDYPSGWMSDNKTILFSSDRMGRSQIFRQQMEHDTAEPLTEGPDDQTGASMTPDGRWILFWSSARVDGPPPATKRLMRYPISGGSPEQVLEGKIDEVYFDCHARPASSCVLSRSEQGQFIFYALDPVEGQGKELARTKSGSHGDWSVSYDGSRIAVEAGGQLGPQIEILDVRNGTERSVQLPHGWHMGSLTWAADGNSLFAAAQSSTYFIVRIALDGKTNVLVDRGRNQWVSFPCLSPDGHHLAFNQQTFENNAWLLENF
jgi:serine/threonine protein kinase/Tol biopolymer transport system component